MDYLHLSLLADLCSSHFLQGLEDQESLELAALCAGLAAAEVWGHDSMTFCQDVGTLCAIFYT